MSPHAENECVRNCRMRRSHHHSSSFHLDLGEPRILSGLVAIEWGHPWLWKLSRRGGSIPHRLRQRRYLLEFAVPIHRGPGVGEGDVHLGRQAIHWGGDGDVVSAPSVLNASYILWVSGHEEMNDVWVVSPPSVVK